MGFMFTNASYTGWDGLKILINGTTTEAGGSDNTEAFIYEDIYTSSSAILDFESESSLSPTNLSTDTQN